MTRMTFHTYDTPCGGPYCTDTWIMNTGKLGYGRTYVSFINKLIHILILFFFFFDSVLDAVSGSKPACWFPIPVVSDS